MGYDTTGTNDKAIIGVAVASALTLAEQYPQLPRHLRDVSLGVGVRVTR